MLKLVALDEDDLTILSAHCQDAVMKVADLVYSKPEKRFALAMNRFVWEGDKGFLRKSFERRRSIVHFDRVTAVKTTGIDRDRPDEVLSLLAARFDPADAPAGAVELTFSGNAAVRLEVECIEARLTDIGAAWETPSRPVHKA